MKFFTIVHLIAPSRSCHRSPSLSDACRRLCLRVCSCPLSLSSVPCYESYEGPPTVGNFSISAIRGLAQTKANRNRATNWNWNLADGIRQRRRLCPLLQLCPLAAPPLQREVPPPPHGPTLFSPTGSAFGSKTEIVIHIHGLRCLGHGFLGFLVLPWTRFTVFSRFVSAVFFFFLWISWAILRLF